MGDCEGADHGGSDCGGPNYDSYDYGGSDYGGLDYGGSDYGSSDYGGSNGVPYVWNGYKPRNVGHTNRQTYRWSLNKVFCTAIMYVEMNQGSCSDNNTSTSNARTSILVRYNHFKFKHY